VTAQLDTIAALLAKAERTDNSHEADAYLAKAQHLATLRSVDLAMVRARTARAERRTSPLQRTIRVGELGKRANTHLVSLFVVVARANDVVVDVARNSTYVIGYGMPGDLEVVETLWGSLAHQMVQAANRYLDFGGWRDETYRALVRQRVGRWSYPRVEERPHTKQTARAAFYRGFIARIGGRLEEARQQAIVEVGEVRGPVRADAPGSESTALVLRAKREEVDAFHRSQSAARGTWSGYRGAAGGDTGSATRAGRAAAARARLSSPRGIDGPGDALPGGSSEVSSRQARPCSD
jgi:hypothetical protein